jgi:hypothetical protein
MHYCEWLGQRSTDANRNRASAESRRRGEPKEGSDGRTMMKQNFTSDSFPGLDGTRSFDQERFFVQNPRRCSLTRLSDSIRQHLGPNGHSDGVLHRDKI